MGSSWSFGPWERLVAVDEPLRSGAGASGPVPSPSRAATAGSAILADGTDLHGHEGRHRLERGRIGGRVCLGPSDDRIPHIGGRHGGLFHERHGRHLECELTIAQSDVVTVLETRPRMDRPSIDEGTVDAVVIGDPEIVLLILDERVSAADRGLLDHQVIGVLGLGLHDDAPQPGQGFLEPVMLPARGAGEVMQKRLG